MGFSTIATGAIVLSILFLFTSVSFTLLTKASISSIEVIRNEATKSIEALIEKIDIVSVTYDEELNKFIITIKNVGTRAIYEIEDIDLVISYKNASNNSVVMLLRFNESWTPHIIRIDNYCTTYMYGRPLFPGESLVIQTINLPPPNQGYPLLIVISSRTGIVAEKRIILGEHQ